jgi:hypothetical protein
MSTVFNKSDEGLRLVNMWAKLAPNYDEEACKRYGCYIHVFIVFILFNTRRICCYNRAYNNGNGQLGYASLVAWASEDQGEDISSLLLPFQSLQYRCGNPNDSRMYNQLRQTFAHKFDMEEALLLKMPFRFDGVFTFTHLNYPPTISYSHTHTRYCGPWHGESFQGDVAAVLCGSGRPRRRHSGGISRRQSRIGKGHP